MLVEGTRIVREHLTQSAYKYLKVKDGALPDNMQHLNEYFTLGMNMEKSWPDYLEMNFSIEVL